jgi:hypothetical protein
LQSRVGLGWANADTPKRSARGTFRFFSMPS